MTKLSFPRLLAAAGFTALLAACAGTEPMRAELPIAPNTSVQEAERRLAAVAAERAAIEGRYTEREAVCYDKFFVNSCLDEAKERRRSALSAQRAIEIDAERYLRRVKVEERDREIAAAEANYKAEEAALAAEPAPREAAPLPPPRPGASARQRQRARDGAPAEKLSAEEQAANVRKFEERKRKSEEKQKEVAQRKAEREAKAARKAAEEAKAAPVVR